MLNRMSEALTITKMRSFKHETFFSCSGGGGGGIESYVSNSHIGFDPDYECH